MLALAGPTPDILNPKNNSAQQRGEDGCARHASAGVQLSLAHGEILFQDGEKRDCAFRVESGGLCHYMIWPDGHHDVIEFAFPGDIIGVGFLADRVSTAQALVDTTVSVLTRAELERILATDPSAAARVAAMADREFEIARARALAEAKTSKRRVASYLIAVDGLAKREGASPTEIAAAASEERLSTALNIPKDEVAGVLEELVSRGLLQYSAGGVTISDREALERVADAA